MADNTAIRPFHFEAPQADLLDLRNRIKATKWPEREQVTDASQGVQLATMQKLAQYWANSYDWRKCEAKISAVANFITEIDGLDIHFIHVRSKHDNALPMIVTHGWPGSIIEQMKIIDPLTNPTAHGGTAADAFHLVIPSLPGYGFSGKPTAPGWNPVSIAKAWATLMQRLGYTKYVAQGGDWGNAVSEVMALQLPPGLLGIHTNMAATVPPDVSKALSAGGPPPGRQIALARAVEFGLKPRDLNSLTRFVMLLTPSLSPAFKRSRSSTIALARASHCASSEVASGVAPAVAQHSLLYFSIMRAVGVPGFTVPLGPKSSTYIFCVMSCMRSLHDLALAPAATCSATPASAFNFSA